MDVREFHRISSSEFRWKCLGSGSIARGTASTSAATFTWWGGSLMDLDGHRTNPQQGLQLRLETYLYSSTLNPQAQRLESKTCMDFQRFSSFSYEFCHFWARLSPCSLILEWPSPAVRQRMDEELAAQEGSQPLLISWVRHWGFLGKMMPFITGCFFFLKLQRMPFFMIWPHQDGNLTNSNRHSTGWPERVIPSFQYQMSATKKGPQNEDIQ